MPASSHEQTLVSGNRRKLMPNDLSSLSRLERHDQPWTYPYWYIRCRISVRYDDHPSCGSTDRDSAPYIPVWVCPWLIVALQSGKRREIVGHQFVTTVIHQDLLRRTCRHWMKQLR